MFDSALMVENGGFNRHTNVYTKPMAWDKQLFSSFKAIAEHVARDQAIFQG